MFTPVDPSFTLKTGFKIVFVMKVQIQLHIRSLIRIFLFVDIFNSSHFFSLRDCILVHLVHCSPFYKGDNFLDLLSAFLHTNPFLQGFYSKRIEFTPKKGLHLKGITFKLDYYFSPKIRLNIQNKLSPKATILTKCQVLFL